MKNSSLIISLLLILNSCFGQKKNYSFSDILYHQNEYAEITFTIDNKTLDTLLVEGELKGTAIIENIPCKGHVTITRDGKLKKFTLAKSYEFGINRFPSETYIEMDINLSSSQDINSIDHYFAIRDAGSQFINLCYFPDLQIIDGISCSANESVFFDSHWNLLGCILAEDDTVKGNLLPKGTFVRLNVDSTMACFCLTDPVIQGYRCAGTNYKGAWMGGGGVFFYQDGALKRFQPADTVMIQGVVCKRSSVRGGVTLYENGSLKKCTSARKQTIDGVMCKENFTLKFDENGKLIYAKKDEIF